MEPEIEGWAKVQGKVCNCNRTKTCKRYLIWLRKANKVHYATACYCYSALLHHSVKRCAEGKTHVRYGWTGDSGLHNISDTPGPVGGKYLSMWLIRD